MRLNTQRGRDKMLEHSVVAENRDTLAEGEAAFQVINNLFCTDIVFLFCRAGKIVLSFAVQALAKPCVFIVPLKILLTAAEIARGTATLDKLGTDFKQRLIPARRSELDM